MLEERKQKEIEFYNRKANSFLKEKSVAKWLGDFERFNPFLLESYKFLQNFLRNRCQDKKILDYGCGNGIHSIWLAKYGAQVIGIDLSKFSLQIARERAKKTGLENKIEFLSMDCEDLKFPENSFDIIFDGGTFSSLDLKKAYPELVRVLKSDGFLIGIETFGHNPIANLKRKINKIFKKRTDWAESHIFQLRDLEEAKKYFNKIEVHFFHILSFLSFPFLDLPGGKILLKLLETLDKLLLNLSFLRKYSFKIVFILTGPKKEI